MKTPKEIVLSLLIELLEPENQKPNMAICESIENFIREKIVLTTVNSNYIFKKCMPILRKTLRNACRDWEHYSGNPLFPIWISYAEELQTSNAVAAYCDCKDYWSGEYGRRRIQLVHRMINSLNTREKI